jgi:hypothetical protein
MKIHINLHSIINELGHVVGNEAHKDARTCIIEVKVVDSKYLEFKTADDGVSHKERVLLVYFPIIESYLHLFYDKKLRVYRVDTMCLDEMKKLYPNLIVEKAFERPHKIEIIDYMVKSPDSDSALDALKHRLINSDHYHHHN